MPRLLRRLLALAVTLSVGLSTLGMAYASCDESTEASNGTVAAMHEMAGMTGMSDMPASGEECDHERGAPTGDTGAGTVGCLLVAHCGVPMLQVQSTVALDGVPAATRQAASAGIGERELALAPEPPPPRG